MSAAILARFTTQLGRLGAERLAAVGVQLEQVQTDAEAVALVDGLEQEAAAADADALELMLAMRNRG